MIHQMIQTAGDVLSKGIHVAPTKASGEIKDEEFHICANKTVDCDRTRKFLWWCDFHWCKWNCTQKVIESPKITVGSMWRSR